MEFDFSRYSKIVANDLSLNGIANMGVRPTVGGEKPVLEVHLFEFNENIYSQRLRVKFVKKITGFALFGPIFVRFINM